MEIVVSRGGEAGQESLGCLPCQAFTGMRPIHPESQSFLESGLFDDLTSFADLESRISAIPGEGKVKGDAFEVFVEAYLNTHPEHLQSVQVWPGASVPADVVERFALTFDDNGIDGVYRTVLGEYHGYQAKFRSGRRPLSWGKDRLSNFIGQTERCDHRVLIANSDDIDAVALQRDHFTHVKGSFFDTLGPDDFEVIRSWLAGGSTTRRRMVPYPQQETAIDGIIQTFESYNRAKVIMACGTGKTLVALWTAERMAVKNILVLVPSLPLLRQILREWTSSMGVFD